MNRQEIARQVARAFVKDPKDRLASVCRQASFVLKSQLDHRSRMASGDLRQSIAVLRGLRQELEKEAKRDLAERVASAFMQRTAGEVRHVKDNSGDSSSWAFRPGEIERNMPGAEYTYDPKQVKSLAKCLRATNAALGHAMSGYTLFAKIKSRMVSPDGKLGGRGYIQKISDMRRQYMNVVEALSALSDTLHDEVHAPHWSSESRVNPKVNDIIEHADEIKDNPEGWAGEEIEQDEEERT